MQWNAISTRDDFFYFSIKISFAFNFIHFQTIYSTKRCIASVLNISFNSKDVIKRCDALKIEINDT